MKKKNKNVMAFATSLSIGAVSVMAPLASIANESDTNQVPVGNGNSTEVPLGNDLIVDTENGIFDDDFDFDSVYDQVEVNKAFKISQSVDGNVVKLDWDKQKDAIAYRVSKFVKEGSSYVAVGEAQIVTENTFTETVENGNYKYRVTPKINGEDGEQYQISNIGEVYVAVNVPADEVPVEEPEVEPEQPVEQPSTTPEQTPEEETPKEETPTTEVEEEQPTDKDEVAAELTDTQLEEIDRLAKEYVDEIANSNQFTEVFNTFLENVSKDKAFLLDFQNFFNNELVPYVEKEAEKIDVNGDLEKQIDELERKANVKYLEFLSENKHFNAQLEKFVENVGELQPQFASLSEEYSDKLVELVGEDLFAQAEDRFIEQVGLNFYEAIEGKLIEATEYLAGLIEDEIVVNIPGETEKPSTQPEKPSTNPSDKGENDEVIPPKNDGVQPPKGTDVSNGEGKESNQGTVNVDEKTNTPTTSTNGGSSVENSNPNPYADPSVPKTGDGTVQKAVSPIVAAFLALAVAFVMVPNRRKTQL